jgi:FKBP-type peptidyl-prolyl cis-trans isomerase SlyD
VPIEKHKVVSFDYTLRDPQGQVLDTSEGGSPLMYLHGVNGLIPGLERQLEGKNPGDAFKAHVPAEEAYGPHQEQLVQKVPRAAFKGTEEIKPGMQFRTESPGGERIVRVTHVEESEVTVDANHPLAGVPLEFDVTVREIRDATAEEISHAHVHGPGGHGH